MLNRFFFRRIPTADQDLYKALRNILGFSPRNFDLYKKALRHKSAAKEILNGVKDSNERLEYLGDAVLDAVIAHFLFQKFPYKDEGFLTKMRSKIVSRKYLNELAIHMGIDRFVESNLENSNKSTSVNGNALEALIGAVYLDKGYNFTRKLIYKRIIRDHIDIESLLAMETDYKSKVIEWGQKAKRSVQFKVSENSSAPMQETFAASVFIGKEKVATGAGSSKKKAEQIASKAAWEHIVKE